MKFALTAALLRPRFGIDDAIGAALTVVAIVLTAAVGVHDSRRPIYGPIDEITHAAYVLAIADDGIPPFLGRDRAYTADVPMAGRDVRIPPPDKVGSAPVPVGIYHDLRQSEAIQPPFYYYAAAPVTWFVSGRDKVMAIRLFDVFLCLCALAVIFLAVRDLSGSPLGGGVAALLMASAGGVIDMFSWVTNGAIMFTLGAAVLWLSARGIRERRLTWPLTLVAAALAITQTIVVPLAAVCALAPAIRHLRRGGREARRVVALRLSVAAFPLALWVLSNLWRYHWVVPKAPGATGIGGLGSATSINLNVYEFTAQFYLSIVSAIHDPFHWQVTSPYVYDWRPLAVFVPLTLVGAACVLLRGSERQRGAVAFWLVAFVVAHFTVFCMLYLAVVLTGAGDFVFRYFTAAEAAAACLAGTCFGALFRNATLQRIATLVAGVVLAYWTYGASPL